jgi:putative heme-binding domain-containing protein
LHRLAKSGRTPQARLHALWTLDGLHHLTDEDVLVGLKDAAPGVRENAVKLAESTLAGRHGPIVPRQIEVARPAPNDLVDALFNLASDPDAFVRLQLAFTLGEINDARAVDSLVTIARHDAADPWIRTAVLSSVASTSDQLLGRLLDDEEFATSSHAGALLRELSQTVGVRGQTSEMQRVLKSGSDHNDVVTGLGDGLKRSGKSFRDIEWSIETRNIIDRLLARAAHTAVDSDAPVEERIAAIHFLTFDTFNHVNLPLVSVLESQQPQEVQRAAVLAIGSFSQPETASALLARWRASAPAVRSEIVLVMLNGRNRILPLLRAVENGVIPASQIPFPRRAPLLRNSDAQVKALAAKLFTDAAPGPRTEVITKYQAALSLAGDAERGRKVFENACASCHRAGDVGKDVGPNLATIRQWNPDQVLINILDPNREVAPNFLGYTIETKNGRTLEGIIADESATSLTLKRADGLTETILRGDIAQLSGSGQSLMPEGLETLITIEQMADLIAFLLSSP